MSNRTLKLVAILSIVAIVFSAFNTYLILDSLQVQEQINAQEKKIDDLETSLELLSIQNEQFNELQSVIVA